MMMKKKAEVERKDNMSADCSRLKEPPMLSFAASTPPPKPQTAGQSTRVSQHITIATSPDGPSEAGTALATPKRSPLIN